MKTVEEMLTFPPGLSKEERVAVRVVGPDPHGNHVDYVIRRKLVPADEGDEVWTTTNAMGPMDDIDIDEARFSSFSDPEVQVTYSAGEAMYDRSSQFVEMRFSCPRFISLGALEDGFNVTVEECGDGASLAIGRAFLWLGYKLLRQAENAARIKRKGSSPP